MTLVGGFPVGADGCVHTTFTHDPSTFRLSSRRPNLQNLPRGSLVRGLFVAPEGWSFWARDFRGIEAVLVGVEAGSAAYTRLARLGVHDWVTAHLLRAQGTLTEADLPDLRWSDADLEAAFRALKQRFPEVREAAKRCVHAGNYLVSPRTLHREYPQHFPSATEAARFLRFYFELFPEIPRWHQRLCQQVDKTTYVRNAFGFIHRFYRVYEWSYDRAARQWVPRYGHDAKRLVAFLPQSNAAFISFEAILRLEAQAPAVARTLRLQIHDELLGLAPDSELEHCLEASRAVMEAPIPQIPLDPTWGLGPALTLKTEGKRGRCWGEMHGG